ncbi:MAG: hypothetical protein OEY45_05245, partial [Gammaproteobacteria bacterium]|nr:hypothetical protein [Gammaproteobacteria bacterium]
QSSGDQEQESEQSSGEQEQESEQSSGEQQANDGEENAEQAENSSESNEDQQDEGDLDKQTEGNDANLGIEITDQGSDSPDADDAGGGAKDKEQQAAGAADDRSAGPGGPPEEISEAETAASQAVDRFDQMEAGQGLAEQGTQQGGVPDKDGIPGTGVSMMVMEQWLEQIEGDPAALLLNQFRIEEQQELQRIGRQLLETRPW